VDPRPGHHVLSSTLDRGEARVPPPDAAISAGDEDELYRHYGVAGDRCPTAVDAPAAGERRDLTGTAGVQGRDTSGPTTDTAMTRSEEKLRALTALTDLSVSIRPQAALTHRPTRHFGRCDEIASVVSYTSTCRSRDMTGLSAPTASLMFRRFCGSRTGGGPG
jgi:hypothetical protein